MVVIAIIVVVFIFALILFIAFRKNNHKLNLAKINTNEQVDASAENAGVPLEDGVLELNDLSSNFDDFNEEEFDTNINDFDLKNNNNIDYSSNYNDINISDSLKKYAFNFDDEDLEFEDDVKRSEIVKEIHNMSPKMKAILFANALDRKDFWS